MDTAHQRAEPGGVYFLHGGIGHIQPGAIDGGDIDTRHEQHDQHEDGQRAEVIERIEIRFGEAVDETFDGGPDFFEGAQGLSFWIEVGCH